MLQNISKTIANAQVALQKTRGLDKIIPYLPLSRCGSDAIQPDSGSKCDPKARATR
jgi:hypothetical protein